VAISANGTARSSGGKYRQISPFTLILGVYASYAASSAYVTVAA
jgi:hypothetical protein